MSVTYRDRLKTTISNIPGTGNFVISSATSGYITFTSSDNALTFDVVIIEGTSWEIRKDCTYTHSGTVLSRGTLVSSSTGSAISFTNAAIIAVTQISDRTLPFTTSSVSTNDVLLYNGTNWVNSPLSFAAKGANSDITSLSGITGGISEADYINFDTVNAQTPGVGKLTWDSANGCLQVGLVGGNVDLQIGQEQVIYAYNDTLSTLTDGQIVYISGAQGNTLAVKLANANSEITSHGTLGMVTEPIASHTSGFITVMGEVHKLNTIAYPQGTQLWLDTVSGGYTNVMPVAPNNRISIGYVVRSHATVGSIYIRVEISYELDELDNVNITSIADKNLLQYDNANSYWKNVTFDSILPTQSGHTGQYLTTNGTNASWATTGGGGVDAIAVSYFGAL